MIRGMTAFARRESQGEWGLLTIEIRTVNHRYLEISTRLPEELRAIETAARERIGAALSRGKVDLTVRHQAATGSELTLNRELAGAIAHLSREVDTLLYDPAPINAIDVLRWPGVLQSASIDPERLHAAVLTVLDEALADLTAARQREGERLHALIEQRLAACADYPPRVRARLPEVEARFRERLRERLAEVKAELDPARVEQEIVLFVQRMDVAEELDRLESHITEVRRTLAQPQPVGRRLDFLMQELNREANTLGSKSADTEMTRAAVDLKVLIEQMREQVQNIE